jgi:hypothetical protein
MYVKVATDPVAKRLLAGHTVSLIVTQTEVIGTYSGEQLITREKRFKRPWSRADMSLVYFG